MLLKAGVRVNLSVEITQTSLPAFVRCATHTTSSHPVHGAVTGKDVHRHRTPAVRKGR